MINKESILLYAARYAYNRNTGAALQVAKTIESEWGTLSNEFKNKINEEIVTEIRVGQLKNSNDWELVLNKYWSDKL
jgi:hypothetical protein